MQSLLFPESLWLRRTKDVRIRSHKVRTQLPLSDFTEPEKPDLTANPIRYRRNSETRFRK
jgi:hypothetical protein